MAIHRFVCAKPLALRCGVTLGIPSGNAEKLEPQDIDQMGSLAGAARLLHHNAGVLKHCSDGTEISRRGAGQRCC